MPEEAVLEPISIDVSTDTSSYETPVESTGAEGESPNGEGADPAVEGQEGQPQQTEADRITAQKPVYDQESKKLDPKIVDTLNKIRETDPTTAARIRNSLAQGEALRAVIPGGVKEAQSLKAFHETVGGEEGFQEVQGLSNEFNTLIDSYNKADPNFIEEMVKSNEDSFLKLAPTIFEKFYALDPEGHSAYVSQILMADMKESDFFLHLTLLGRSAAATDPAAKESLDAINAYVNRIRGYAQKPVNSKREVKAPDTREVELNQERTRFEAQKFETFEAQETARGFESEFAKLIGNRKVSADDMATIREIFRTKMKLSVQGVKRFQENRSKYFNARDSAGHQKYISSTFKTVVPEAVKYAVNRVLKAAPANGKPPAAPPQQQQRPGQPQQRQTGKDAQGFNWIDKAPRQEQLDPRTNNEMLKSGKAILAGGKPVRWR